MQHQMRVNRLATSAGMEIIQTQPVRQLAKCAAPGRSPLQRWRAPASCVGSAMRHQMQANQFVVVVVTGNTLTPKVLQCARTAQQATHSLRLPAPRASHAPLAGRPMAKGRSMGTCALNVLYTTTVATRGVDIAMNARSWSTQMGQGLQIQASA